MDTYLKRRGGRKEAVEVVHPDSSTSNSLWKTIAAGGDGKERKLNMPSAYRRY